MTNVIKIAGQQVVHADDLMARADEPVTKMRPEESCTADQECPGRTNFILMNAVILPPACFKVVDFLMRRHCRCGWNFVGQTCTPSSD